MIDLKLRWRKIYYFTHIFYFLSLEIKPDLSGEFDKILNSIGRHEIYIDLFEKSRFKIAFTYHFVGIFITIRIRHRYEDPIDIFVQIAVFRNFNKLVNNIKCSGRRYPLSGVDTGIAEYSGFVRTATRNSDEEQISSFEGPPNYLCCYDVRIVRFELE